MCKMKVFSPGNIPDVNCTDYCGTDSEECNSTDMNGAHCENVGCHGDGEPTCTPFCKLDYAKCTPGAGEMSLKVGIVTDNKGVETQWEVRGESGVIWKSDTIYKSLDIITLNHCMERGCYQFEIFDSGGDGLCCEEGSNFSGKYALMVDNVRVNSTNPSFGKSIIHEVGNCQPVVRPSAAPTIIPSSYPSSYPSSIPSHLSSSNPSISPQPASSPSSIPTELPSSNPSISRQPTSSPSSIPTELPSSNPFISPTSSPSYIPTELPSSNPSMSSQPTSSPSYIPTELPSSLPTVSYLPTEKSNKLLPPDGAPGDEFGWDVAMSSTTIAVSAPKSGNGKVYLFSADSWEYTSLFVSSDGSGSDEFGSALAVQDDVLIVGAVKGNKAYIISISGAFASIALSEGNIDDEFGSSVAIDGDAVVIGAPGNDEFGDNSGAAYLFSVAGTWIGMILPPSFVSNINFGASVDVDGPHIAVGAPLMDGKGAVFIYESSAGTYLGVKIQDSNGMSGDMFGLTMAMRGNTIVIGAPLDDSQGTDAGAVYICSADGINMRKDFAEDASSGAMFGGGTVAISSDKIVMSAINGGIDNTGSVYVYNSTRVFTETVVADDSENGDEFGRSVTAWGEVFVVGVPYDDDNGDRSGSAYVFR